MVKHLSDEHLRIENDRLRRQNAQLRHALRLQNGRHAKRVDRAFEAALLLAELHCAFLDTARRPATVGTLTQRQWTNGMALLRLARVVHGRRWRLHDLASIEERLERARAKALECPEAFRAMLPPSARDGETVQYARNGNG